MLPRRIVRPLRAHLERVHRQHKADLACGTGYVELPMAIARKYPRAGREWAWQWVFPATRRYRHPETGEHRRHHLHESVVQRAVRMASREVRYFSTCETPPSPVLRLKFPLPPRKIHPEDG